MELCCEVSFERSTKSKYLWIYKENFLFRNATEIWIKWFKIVIFIYIYYIISKFTEKEFN